MSIYGLIIGIAFVIGFEIFSRKNKLIPKNKESLFFILLFIFSIIGARIYGVLSYWDYFSNNPLEIINTRSGGLGIFGGLIFGIIFIYVFSKFQKISFLKILNLLAPIIPLCQSIGRFGNYFNREIYSLSGLPVWLFESILDLVLFFILLKLKKNQMAMYLIGYGIIRFLLEFLRWDTWVLFSIKIGQVLALFFVIVGLLMIRAKTTND